MTNLIIIGGGSSIKDFPLLFDDIIGHDVMSINYTYKFLKEAPKYQVSIDAGFWNKNIPEMSALELAGCKLIQRNKENKKTKEVANASGDCFFTGKRNLSGVFALDYAIKKLNYDNVYLFGFDFGLINGQTHFYDNIDHSGIGKDRAYIDKNGKVLEAVNDFDYFKGGNIRIVGESNVMTFKKIKYKIFLEEIKNGNI